MYLYDVVSLILTEPHTNLDVLTKESNQITPAHLAVKKVSLSVTLKQTEGLLVNHVVIGIILKMVVMISCDTIPDFMADKE